MAILLFLVLWQMTGDLWPAPWSAAVFAVHPLRAESVAWVAERKDLLSGLFFMLTLAAYLSYVRHPFSLARYLLVAVSFALGLMAKPMLVTLPFVLLLLDYWPLGRMKSPHSARGGGLHLRCPQQFAGEAVHPSAPACGGEDSAGGAGGRFVRGHVVWRSVKPWPSPNACRFPRESPTPWSPMSPMSDSSSIRWGWRRSILIPKAVCRLEGCRGGARLGRRFRGRVDRAAAISLPVGRLALVSWNARARDRIGAGGRSGHGRPLHVLAGDRFVRGRGLGRGTTVALLAAAALGLRRCLALAVTILAGLACRQTSYWRNSETLWTHTLAARSTTPRLKTTSASR